MRARDRSRVHVPALIIRAHARNRNAQWVSRADPYRMEESDADRWIDHLWYLARLTDAVATDVSSNVSI